MTQIEIIEDIEAKTAEIKERMKNRYSQMRERIEAIYNKFELTPDEEKRIETIELEWEVTHKEGMDLIALAEKLTAEWRELCMQAT